MILRDLQSPLAFYRIFEALHALRSRPKLSSLTWGEALDIGVSKDFEPGWSCGIKKARTNWEETLDKAWTIDGRLAGAPRWHCKVV